MSSTSGEETGSTPNTCTALILHPSVRLGASTVLDGVNTPWDAASPSRDPVGYDPHQSTVLQSFTIFPNLPVEMRLVIWELALADLPPRIVFKRAFLEIFPTKRGLVPDNRSQDPTLMHVNRESREAALKVYQTYGTRPGTVEERIKVLGPLKMFNLSPLCFNPATDTLLCYYNLNMGPEPGYDIWMYETPQAFPSVLKRTVRHIATSCMPRTLISELDYERISLIVDATYFERIFASVFEVLREFTALETLSLIAEGDHGSSEKSFKMSSIQVQEFDESTRQRLPWELFLSDMAKKHPDFKVPEIKYAKMEFYTDKLS
ncbi:hypothetical protein B2J93_2828 [Marssonina coronariae]|uniref:2EXR domain-containing protein n=1 Tax=Diplocarpon coronariae TaxID=2795749 RepID=A0A218Z0E8_9HELO|nr:hypothetical protein JHW43_004643 [Diplocarpon mali]OWP01418.1 hypothetical protein B2J93_2828 [Marssonina coronariae]